MQRRNFIAALGAAALSSQLPAQTPARKGRYKQSAMRMNFDPKLSTEEVYRIAAEAGCKGFDMAPNNEWPLLKKYGLECSIAATGGVNFNDGLIRPETHPAILKSVGAQIDACAAAGVKSIITVGGQRKGMSYEQGMDNAAKFLNEIKKPAEDKGVTICLEVMNTRYTPPELGRVDQICDHIGWAVELAKRVNSPGFKILFDIYHVQTMDGNIVDNMRNNIQWIGHFHTGGVPGRRELNESQELNYRFIAQAIAETGFSGYIGHEYRLTPGKDSLKELTAAVRLMDV